VNKPRHKELGPSAFFVWFALHQNRNRLFLAIALNLSGIGTGIFVGIWVRGWISVAFDFLLQMPAFLFWCWYLRERRRIKIAINMIELGDKMLSAKNPATCAFYYDQIRAAQRDFLLNHEP